MVEARKRANVEQRVVELCRREKRDLWSFHIYGSGDKLELASLDIHLPVTAIYEDVEFAFDESHTSS